MTFYILRELLKISHFKSYDVVMSLYNINSVAAKCHYFHVSLGTVSGMPSEQLHLLGEEVGRGVGLRSASEISILSQKCVGMLSQLKLFPTLSLNS